eukprot:10981236-Alexandrium_andersonii.AAC.1
MRRVARTGPDERSAERASTSLWSGERARAQAALRKSSALRLQATLRQQLSGGRSAVTGLIHLFPGPRGL